MTGIIVSNPPTVELPPGSTTGGSAVLPGVTYTYALLGLPQTWTAKQTFPLGTISIQAGDIQGTLFTLTTTGSSGAATYSGGVLNIPQYSGGGGTPGGSSGQLQYNNSGAFGGYTMSGDATLVPSTGVITIANNAVTNAKMATMAANTIKANATGSSAVPTDVDISALTTKASPTGSDWVMISDQAASGALKKAAFPTGGSSALPTRFWSGYTQSNNVTTPNTKIDVAAGSCRDSTDAINIVNTSGTIDCGSNGAVNTLDTGTLGASTWYYTFAITTAGGSTGFLASLSATSPTLPATYTKFRRIGSFKTDGSSHIIAFKHVNNQWWWNGTSVPRDVNGAAVNNTNTTSTLSVPRVLGVKARIAPTVFPGTAVAATFYVYPTWITITATTGGGVLNYNTTQGAQCFLEVQVDSSAQINWFVSTASGTHTVVIDTQGWTDDL